MRKQNIGNRKEVKILICIMKEILTRKISRLSRKKKEARTRKYSKKSKDY